MAVAALAALSRLQLSEALRRQLGVPPGPLTLRRAWPRGDDRMALELVTAGGVILAGQSFTRADATSDNQRAARVARRSQTTVPTATAVALPGTGVVLQAGGADRRLPALATVVADPAATLVAHRPERRAVVRLDSDAADEVLAAPLEPRSGEAAGVRYAKLVRPGRSGGLVKTAQAAFTLACMRTPRVVAHDATRGLVVFTALAGTSLEVLAARGDAAGTAQQLGLQLRALHVRPAPASLPLRDAAAEADWTMVWVRRLRRYDPSAA